MTQVDYQRLKRNIAKMISMNAPEQDIDDYLAEEGVTAEQMRAAPKLEVRPQPSEGPERSNLAEKVNRDGSAPKKDMAIPFIQGATLNFGDEIMSGLAAPIATAANKLGLMEGDALPRLADNYDQGRALLQAQQARLEAENPGAALAAEVGGALTTAKLPVGLALKGGNMATKIAKGAAAGAAYGGTAGFGEGEGIEDRLAKSKEGAEIGAAVGFFAPPVGKIIGKTYGAAANAVRTRALAKEAGVSPKVLKDVAGAFADDRATGGLNALSKLDPGADLLLNRGNALETLAEHIVTQPGKGRNIVLNAVRNQQKGAGQRTIDTVNQTLGNDLGRVHNAAGLEAERKAAGQLYNMAKLHKGTFDLTALRDSVDDMVQNTDGSIRNALVKVRRLHLFDGATLSNVDANRLHAGRMAIDDLLNKPGIGSNAARLLRNIRGEVDDALKTHVPGWQQADDLYSGAMKRKEALEAGRDVFKRSYGSPDELRAEIQGMKPAERSDFLKGARDSISELMGGSRNDALAARRDLLDKGWNREKLQLLIGNAQAQILENRLVKEAALAQTAQNITSNSRTALRQNARKAFPGATDNSPHDVRSVSTLGLVLQQGKKALNALVGRRRGELSRQAADLLTRRARDVEPILRLAQRQSGRALDRREKIEAVASYLAYSSLPALQQQRPARAGQ